mgnify:CR=1 FL=1
MITAATAVAVAIFEGFRAYPFMPNPKGGTSIALCQNPPSAHVFRDCAGDGGGGGCVQWKSSLSLLLDGVTATVCK